MATLLAFFFYSPLQMLLLEHSGRPPVTHQLASREGLSHHCYKSLQKEGGPRRQAGALIPSCPPSPNSRSPLVLLVHLHYLPAGGSPDCLEGRVESPAAYARLHWDLRWTGQSTFETEQHGTAPLSCNATPRSRPAPAHPPPSSSNGRCTCGRKDRLPCSETHRFRRRRVQRPSSSPSACCTLRCMHRPPCSGRRHARRS